MDGACTLLAMEPVDGRHALCPVQKKGMNPIGLGHSTVAHRAH
uniref:Uncharacterized protein n=1 Tax=Triticum urartu TaxID=4572 RepID=A0A8R7TMR0_TRIUA